MSKAVPIRLALAALVLTDLLTIVAPAATTNWNVGSGGFNTAGNWDNGVPGVNDLAVFRRGSVPAYSVTFGNLLAPISPTINRLIVGTNTLTFNVTNSSLTAGQIIGHGVPIGGDMIIGQAVSDVAVLNSNLANLSAHDATLGSAASSSGTLNLMTSTAKFNVTGVDEAYDLIVGASGTGAINISGGADVTVADITVLGLNGGSTGNVSVSGSGSTWTNTATLIVGSSGIGSLSISAGGIVESAASLLGAAVQGDGRVTMSGGCEWNMPGNLYVGYAGTGTVDVTGGRITSGFANIGNTSGFAGYVSISGLISRWDIAGPLYIWNGTFTVANSATVNGHFTSSPPTTALIGNSGAVTVSGATWNTEGPLSIYSGGTLTITNRGYVGIRGGGIGLGSSGLGDVAIEGASSQLECFGALDVGSELAAGRLTVRDGGRATATSPVVVGGLGEIRGNGFIFGNVQNGGLVSPGTSADLLRFQNNYIQTATGKLLIEVASATSFDQLLISGDVTLGGTLAVNLLDGFIPSIGQAFTILTANSVNGTFGTKVLPTVPNLAFDVVYNAQSVAITVMSALAGDYNGNGVVDAADYVEWRKNDGGPSAYNTWRSNFGATIGSGAGFGAGATIPEPGTLLLLVVGMPMVFARMRRR